MIRISAQTTLLEFAILYSSDLQLESITVQKEAEEQSVAIRKLRENDDGSDEHRRAIVTAQREAEEDFRITGAHMLRRRTFMEQLQHYVEPLFQGEQQ